MIRRDYSNVKLPRISTSSSEAVVEPSTGKRHFRHVDFQNCRQQTKDPNHAEKTAFWRSAKYCWKPKEEQDGWETFVGRKRNQGKPSNAKSVDYTCTREAKFVLPLRRHNSEPQNLLQQNANPFTVNVTSLKLNQRPKEKIIENNEKQLNDLLPSVFFDTSDSTKGKLSREKMTKHRIENSTKLDKNISEKTKVSKSTNHKDIDTYERVKNNQKVKKSDIDHEADKGVRKTLKSLSKRRLSEQIDSYEINQNNHNAFPRKITIRTSKSCPTIVIHECGEYDETSNDSCAIKDREGSGNDTSLENSSEQMNGCRNLNKDTTSFVPYWKPKQSIVKTK